MAVMSSKVRKQLLSNPTLEKDVVTLYNELVKLVNYYKAEIKQMEINLKRAKEPEEIAFFNGSLRAYSDHLSEVSWFADSLRGWQHDEEEK